MKSKQYQQRFYRDWVKKQRLNFYEVMVEETDLLISSEQKIDVGRIEAEIIKYRRQIKDYIAKNEKFLSSLVPIEVSKDAAPIVREMAAAAKLVGVGPMAAVAGAVDEFLARNLFSEAKEAIIENGGDIFIKTTKPRKIGIYAGDSPLCGKVSIEITPEQTPCGVCCSSGTVGHSLSFGKADAAVIVAKDAILADALATAVSNRVKSRQDTQSAIDFGKKIPGVKGILVIIDETLSVWGEVKIV